MLRLEPTIQKLIKEEDYRAWYASKSTGAQCLPLVAETTPSSSSSSAALKKQSRKKRKKKKRRDKKIADDKQQALAVEEEEVKNPEEQQEEELHFFSDVLCLEFEESMINEKGKIFLRLQQRTSRKYFTIVWGFPIEIDLKSVCKEMASRFQCGGSVVEKPGQRKGDEVKIKTVQLQGDHRHAVIDYLFENDFVTSRDQITTIGF
jgi:translation initiation factor SUI1